MRILDGYLQTGASLQAVYPHRRHLAGKVRALIDHLVEWFESPSGELKRHSDQPLQP